MARSMLHVIAFAILAASGGPSRAAIVPFTEDFNRNAANWFDLTGANLLDWMGAGGRDGGPFVSTLHNFVNANPEDPIVLFRGHDKFDSSGDAFVGDWLADGVSEFSFFFRHDAIVPVTLFVRFASSMNFPGAVAV